MFSSVHFPKNQFYLHKLHIHTYTLKHSWHFLPFQIIILTKRKPSFSLCLTMWLWFLIIFYPGWWLTDIALKTWKLILLWLPLCDQESISNDSCQLSRLTFPFAPYLGKLITNICVLHHWIYGHFKQYKYQPRRVPRLQVQFHQQ